jgi:GDP-D-mannose dehydratase
MSEKIKPGAKLGNTNAQRDMEAATSFIHARCTAANKATWIATAQAQNLKLTEWIVKTLNNAG